MVDAGQLVGAHEIAERLGLKRVQHVHWYHDHDTTFPGAIARIGRGGTYVWYWPDIEEWARKSGRLPAGPKNP
jgi:predicted DNA-binding transcriptional regulator AlpA